MGRSTVALLLILLVATPGVHAEEDPEQKIARLAEEPGNEALSELEAMLENTDDPRLRKIIREALAYRFLRDDNPYASLEHFEVLMQTAPEPWVRISYAEALIRTARKNLGSGNTTAAGVVPYLIDARKAVEGLDPKALEDPDQRGRLVRLRAESWFYAGEMDKALAELPEDVVAPLVELHKHACLELRGQVLYRLGKFTDAGNAFEAAGNVRGAAASWSAGKDAKKTVAAYSSLLTATPHDVSLLSEALAAVRYAGGVVELEAALAEIPVEGEWKARYLVARAELRRMTENASGAVELLRDAAALDTSYTEPLVQIARIHLADVDADPSEARGKAVEALLEALNRNPSDESTGSFLWHLAGVDYGELWKAAGTGPELERCIRVQRALLATAEDDALGWANLGNTLRVGGRTDEALDAYKRAKQENPYDPAIISDEGLSLAAAGRFDDALAAYLASIKLDSSHLAGRQNAARALWLKGKDPEARAQLSAAIRKARPLRRNPMTYRFLLDRVWRTQQDDALR